MKWFLFLMLLPGSMTYGQQQPYDSLVQRLAVEKIPSKKLDLINQLGTVVSGFDMLKGLEYAKQGARLADSLNDKHWQPRLYATVAKAYSNNLKLDSAIMFYEKAMSGYLASKDKEGQATIFLRYSPVYKRKGQTEKALTADLNGLRLMEELNNQQGIAAAYEGISDDLTRQGRLAEALEYAKKSIETCEKFNIQQQLPFSFFNMGAVYIAMNDLKPSLAYYNKAVEKANELKLSPTVKARFIISRGNALKRMKQYPLALQDYENALAIAKTTNYPQAISTAIANLGEVNLLTGNFKEALAYQLETVRLQEKNQDLLNLTENYQHVSSIYEKLNDYKLALYYQKKARVMRDSVNSLQSDTAMSNLLTKYQAEKREATIAAQQREISQQNTVQWLSTGVAVLLAGFLVFGYRSFRNRSKRNKLLAAKNTENELLLKEIHHRVKNNLEIVSSLLALQSAQIDDPITKEAMQEGQNRVHSIGIVHQKLYQGENLGTIEMKDYFLNLTESILDSFGAEKRVEIELAMDKLDVDIDTAVPLGLIVNELLTNTIKYAFPQGQTGKVRIRLEKLKDGVLHLEVSDNGVGKSGTTRGTGFGGQLVSLLTSQLSGSMREDLKNGTAVFFDFKPEKVA